MQGQRSTLSSATTAVFAILAMVSTLLLTGTTDAAATTTPVINEFGIDDASTDSEFIEIFGQPSTDYSNLTVLEIEGDSTGAGTIDEVIPVGTTDAAGIWAMNLPSNAFENGTVTLLLVDGFTGALGHDIDATNDGVIDAPAPWAAVLDSVSLTDGGSTALYYGTPLLTEAFDDAHFDSPFEPGGASRIPDGLDTDSPSDWRRNDFDWDGTTNGSPVVGEAYNTPGAPNELVGGTPPPPPTGGIPFPHSNGFDSDDCTTGGWQVVSVDVDTANTWSCSARFSNADVNGFGDMAPADEWLISPAFDMEAQTDETLEFRSYTRFTDAVYPPLEVLWSADYDGVDPTAATWTPLATTLSPENSSSWTGSGTIDLSGIAGSAVHFAWHYISTGTGGGSAANWRVDGIEFSTGPAIRPIHAVQGAGASVAISGDVIVDGVVTSLFTRDDVLDGFFLQEPDGDADSDPATSEGIYIHCRANCPTALAVGDTATVAGTAGDFFGMSQVDATAGTVAVTGTAPLPTAVPVDLPAAGSTLAESTFEATEGMVVSFVDTLVVSEYFQLSRFGQVVLTADARPEQFTDANPPSPAGYAAHLADLATRRIILDDDNNDQNDAIFDGPDEPYPYRPTGFSTANYFRGGDTIDAMTGVLHWSWAGSRGTDAWRVRPIDGHRYQFTDANPRPATAPDVGGTIQVAAFNVLNYFVTLDEPGAVCGPFAEGCRGAHSAAELDRQRAKTVSAILELDADIVGLVEIENDSGAATADLVAALNGATAPGTWAAIDAGVIGPDVIKVALIYTPATVRPLGDHVVLDDSVDPTFTESKNRPVLIQTFEEIATGGEVTVAVNHLKSKGSPCDDVGDPGRDDGQANCPGTRTAGAVALANYLATDPTGSNDTDFLIIGDLNAYAMEDPITALAGAGYTDLLAAYQGPGAYTYVFDGQLGYLDHALSNASLTPQVTGAAAWHINADEVNVLDYNDDVRDAGEASFERESSALPLYAPDAFRSSDHDPVVVGLNLVPSDDDGDGVPNIHDVCPGTVLPDEPTHGLKSNRYAATIDGFVDGDGNLAWSMADTGGCSGAQIIEAMGLGQGHTRFGISKSALDEWVLLQAIQ